MGGIASTFTTQHSKPTSWASDLASQPPIFGPKNDLNTLFNMKLAVLGESMSLLNCGWQNPPITLSYCSEYWCFTHDSLLTGPFSLWHTQSKKRVMLYWGKIYLRTTWDTVQCHNDANSVSTHHISAHLQRFNHSPLAYLANFLVDQVGK